jgi:hypothetical protein
MLEQFFYSQLDVPQDGAEKTGTYGLAGVNRNGGDSSVLMPEENVAATSPNHLETDSFEDSHDFFTPPAGKASHTEIC